MIDIHCHILPAVDDGSASLQQSLSMARQAAADGIRHIVATPHTLNGLYTNRADKVIAKVEAFQRILDRSGIDLKIYPGADACLCPKMVEKVRGGLALTINNAGKFILLELPSQVIPAGVKDEIFALKLNGITPIITHAERNAAICRDMALLHELVNMGALSQTTAQSLTGDFGAGVQQAARILMQRGLVHLIASDAHSDNRRPPVLSAAVEVAATVLKDRRVAKNMVTAYPAAVLAGKMPDVPEPSRP